MRKLRDSKFILPVILIIAMAVFSIATLETSIPTASYEIINDTEIAGLDSIEITNSSFPSESSVVLLNDSVMSSDSYWMKRGYTRYNVSRFSRSITVPFLNISEVIFRVKAFIVEGPLNISLYYYHSGFHTESKIGQKGEFYELVMHLAPEDYIEDTEGPNTIWVSISFEGQDWSVLDQLYFSVQVEFTDVQIPVTIDLQRTNGESMFLLPEFRTIYEKPRFSFNEYRFYLSQANDTIFLPNGNFTLWFNWWGYNKLFNNVTILNQSLRIVIRIRTIRLDVESVQNIPGLTIEVGNFVLNELYGAEYAITDSPSFYLPSGKEVPIECEGGPIGYGYTNHFYFSLQSGVNRNITLLVNENWILLGNTAITLGRLAILCGSLIILGLTVVFSRKELVTSSVYTPFILMFLGYIIPSVEITSVFWSRPLYSLTTVSDSISLGTATSISSWSGSATTIARANGYLFDLWGLIPLFMLLLVFVGVVWEILNEDLEITYPDILIGFPIILYLWIQCIYVIGMLDYVYYDTFATIGFGPFLTVLAFVLWVVLYKRQGKKFFESLEGVKLFESTPITQFD